MAIHTPSQREQTSDEHLGSEFVDRLTQSLDGADRARSRRAWIRRLRATLPIVLLVGPIVGWRLMLSSPDGMHVAIGTLSWVAFVLDIGVHADASLLSSLSLQWLPTVMGVLLFVLVAITLLWERDP
jgi:hypothetical protein